jgi:hypothetical protein
MTDSVQQISLSHPQAAKVHLCFICRAPIAIGQCHIRHVIKDTALRTKPIFTARYHIHCSAVFTDD